MKNLTQVYHSFLHNNNSPTNHVAQFVSHAGQFLCWNRAVFYCVWETCITRASFLYKTTCTSFWYKFPDRVSPALHKPIT